MKYYIFIKNTSWQNLLKIGSGEKSAVRHIFKIKILCSISFSYQITSIEMKKPSV